MNLEFAYRCSIQREQAHHSGIPAVAKLTRISKINAQLEIFLWQLRATCSTATCLLFLEHVKNLGKREDITSVCQFWLNRYYLPIKEFPDSCKWDLNWFSQHPQVTALPVGKLCKHRRISHLQFFTKYLLTFLVSQRSFPNQCTILSWPDIWPDILHGGNGLWNIMDLLLKILAKLFTNSFFVRNSFTPILKKVKKCKVNFIRLCFTFPVFKVSSKTCAVLYHGNVSFQINKFTKWGAKLLLRINLSGHLLEHDIPGRFWCLILQKISLTDTYLGGVQKGGKQSPLWRPTLSLALYWFLQGIFLT